MTNSTASTALSPLSIASLTDLTGRTSVVTGAAKGIGLAIAHRLHEAGANVVVADIDPSAHDVADTLDAARPGSAVAISVDISGEEGAASAVAKAIDAFGGIDILVNDAGIFPTVPFLEIDPATFRHVIDVNLVGLALVTQAAARQMVDRGRGGRIINVTSIDALHPSMPGLAHYDASKHGVWGLTKSLALELAPHDIRVNAIAPGGVITPGIGDIDDATLQSFAATIPMGRMGVPDDIARGVLFLASDLASYVTGSQLVVDGGRLLA